MSQPNVIEVKTLSELNDSIDAFLEAHEKEYPEAQFAVVIETKGYPDPEIIINTTRNMHMRKRYFNGAYNENLVSKRFDGIRITGFYIVF